MKLKSFCAYIAVFFTVSFLSGLELIKNNERLFLLSSNDKFSYGISHNLDDQFSFSFGVHTIFPYLYVNFDLNGITNRGYKTDVTDETTFFHSRYDELSLLTGTQINLYQNNSFSINLDANAGFIALGNFGGEKVQNITHVMDKVPTLVLPYEKPEHNFSPSLNCDLKFAYNINPIFKLQFTAESKNSLFYFNREAFTLSTIFGNEKTLLEIFSGYEFLQNQTDSQTFSIYANQSQGYNFGWKLDTGFFKFDYLVYTKGRFGYGTLYVDLFNLNNRDFTQSDLYSSFSITKFMGTTYLETQLQCFVPNVENLYITYNNRYVSGYKKNLYSTSDFYRIERDYDINSIGLKYEYDIPAIKNWVTPFTEIATGVTAFGIRKLSNHKPESTEPYIDYGMNFCWELEATAGVDLFPEHFIKLGTANYQLSLFAGVIVIPEYKKISEFIKKDTYRTNTWKMNLFEPSFGFSVKMGLDF